MAIGDTLRSARELRAVDFVGWPVAWLTQRLTGRDPLRKVRVGMLWNELRAVSTGPAGAQQASIDNALTEFGDRLAVPLPKPWSQTIRTAVRSHADAIPAAVGEAIGGALPVEDSVEGWWRVAGLAQGVLLGAVAIGLGWFVAVLVLGVFGAGSGLPDLLSNPVMLAWAVLLAGGALGLGAGLAAICMSRVRKQALNETAVLAASIRNRIQGVALELAIEPAEQEVAEFVRLREAFDVASNGPAGAAAAAAESGRGAGSGEGAGSA